MIVSLAETRDPGLGPRFHTLAASLRSGSLRLSEALETVPRFLPKQIVAMLRVGEKLGDIRKVMPACRHLVKDSMALTRNSVHYLLVATFATTPVAIAILAVLQTYVLPQFEAVVQGMGMVEGVPLALPPGLRLLQHQSDLFWIEIMILLVVWVTASFYIGMPPIFYWFQRLFPSTADRLNFALPWKHKRLQRDFSSMLAMLLDGGVPEPEAVTLAADCTANVVFIRRTRKVVAALKQGVKLTEALRILDDSGEFHWRLTNAVHGHGGFFKAIEGWNESLDAKAFQQEQSTAQVVTSGLVILNGLFVGFIVVSVFSALIAIINSGALW
jgi:type II secretory pathway component PulF